MVASTDIKFFVHTNNNAPQLQNAYGSMISVLNAALVDGIFIGNIASLTVDGVITTATFTTPHNLMQYQVLKIAGANQSEFNKEFKILNVPSATTVMFELEVAPSVTTATGSLSASLPPLGWEKSFSSSNPSGGGKAAYRSKNLLLPSRPFLRVVDEPDPSYNTSYAKYAKVGIVEDLIDIDTMVGVQSPVGGNNITANWVGTGSGTAASNGWAKWYYARSMSSLTASQSNDTQTPSTGARNYIIIGTSDWFYVMPSMIPGDQNLVPYGFGCFERISDTDLSPWFLSCTLSYQTASTGLHISALTPIINSANESLILYKNYSQGNYVTARISVVQMVVGTNIISGSANYQPAPSMIGYIASSEACILESTSVVRGVLPGILICYQYLPVAQHLGYASINDEQYIAVMTGAANNAARGQILIKISHE